MRGGETAPVYRKYLGVSPPLQATGVKSGGRGMHGEWPSAFIIRPVRLVRRPGSNPVGDAG